MNSRLVLLLLVWLCATGFAQPTSAQPCITAPCLEPSLEWLDARTGRKFDPDITRPPHYFHLNEIRTVGPSVTTSNCVGQFDSPICALETFIACRLPHFDLMCRELRWSLNSPRRDAVMRDYVIVGGRALTRKQVEWKFFRDIYEIKPETEVIAFDIWLRGCTSIENCRDSAWWDRYGVFVVTNVATRVPLHGRSSIEPRNPGDILRFVDTAGNALVREIRWAESYHFRVTKIPEPGDPGDETDFFPTPD